jgi:hypothetical protein
MANTSVNTSGEGAPRGSNGHHRLAIASQSASEVRQSSQAPGVVSEATRRTEVTTIHQRRFPTT